MCGIVGALSFGEADEKLEKLRKDVTSFLVTELLLLTAERGKDATGVATLFDNGDFMGLKMGIPSPEFVSRFGNTSKDYEGFLKIFKKNPRQCRALLGHCRKSSIGNYWDNNNNHPIKVGDIVGIHNGTLTNHKKIIEKLECKNDGDVDSEAIFRLAHYLTNGSKDPFTIEMMYQTAIRLDGSYAVLMFNGNNPYQVGAMRKDRPMEFVLIKPLKMLFVASEKKFLETAMWRMNKEVRLYGHENLIFLQSDDVDFQMMYDDHVAVFDLTKEVAKDTKVTQLMEDKRIVVTDKKWQTVGNTTFFNNRSTNWQGNKTDVKTVEVNADDKEDKTDITKDVKVDKKLTGKVGMVWNRGVNEFEAEENTDDTDKLGNVQIEVDVGNVIEVGTKDKNITADIKLRKKGKATTVIEPVDEKVDPDAIVLEEVEDGCEDLVTDPAKVNEIALKQIEKERSKKKTETVEGTVIKVNASEISFDSVALEKANTASESLKKCENEDDVVEQFQLEDKSVLKVLPVHSLANRLKSFVYKLGFYEGYVLKGEEDATKTDTDDDRRKREKNIRVLKTMAVVLARIIDGKSTGLDAGQIRAIDVEVAKSLEKKEEISSVDLKEIFSAGDFRKEKVLKVFITELESRERR